MGRIKDVIIIRGVNYYPQDSEVSVEQAHPAIRSGCVAAISINENEREKLVILAEVQRGRKWQERSSDSAEVIQNTILSHISKTLKLAASHIVLLQRGSLPKTSSGKLQRQRSKALYLSNKLKRWNKN